MRRRLARDLLAALTAASLVACMAACVLWARSYRSGGDRARQVGDAVAWKARSRDGVIHLWCTWLAPLEPSWRRRQSVSNVFSLVEARDLAFGFGFVTWNTADPVDGAALKEFAPGVRSVLLASVPHWAVVLATSFPVAAWGWASVRRRRQGRVAGRCAICGYDLRATPGRCPECGTPAK